MANSAKAEVIDKLKDEEFPMFGPSPAYPYLGLIPDAIANGDIIDTVEDLNAAADALNGARHQMVLEPAGVAGFQILYSPSTIQTVLADGTVVSLEDIVGSVDTLKLHEYSALLGFSGVLGTSQMSLGMASMMQFIRILSIIVWVALMAAVFVFFKLARACE